MTVERGDELFTNSLEQNIDITSQLVSDQWNVVFIVLDRRSHRIQCLYILSTTTYVQFCLQESIS
jgi:hypothetical protein